MPHTLFILCSHQPAAERRPSHNAVCAGDASLTRMGSDTHQTRCVPQPAPVAGGLSIPAPSAAPAQWQRLWHLSQSFKCLLFSAGWLGERRSRGKDDILCHAGGGTCCGSALPASSGCQLQFPLSQSEDGQINPVVVKRPHKRPGRWMVCQLEYGHRVLQEVELHTHPCTLYVRTCIRHIALPSPESPNYPPNPNLNPAQTQP